MKTEVMLEQGSQEWLDFRRQYRMASETPAIMGLSPYQTVYDVRSAKLGKVAFATDAMRHGIEQEQEARAEYEKMFEPMRPAMFVSCDYGCSLDGINIDGSVILEIKTPYKDARNSDRWLAVSQGNLRPDDYAQVQHQLMVTGASEAHFLVFDAESRKFIMTTVAPDPAFWEKIRAAWDAVWPILCNRDDPEWAEAASAYRAAKEALEHATAEAEKAKNRLIEMTTGQLAAGGGVEVRKIERAGAVDWSAVKKQYLPDLDVEHFRKKATTYFEVRVID
jgi:putative phage-type endonuclease